MISDVQQRSAEAIVQIFETSKVRGDYGKVTLIPDDPGHLTYGKAQCTLTSGTLFQLIKQYCDDGTGAFVTELDPYLERLQEKDLSLDGDTHFKTVLRQSGDEPNMQRVQDSFFDRIYYSVARKSWEQNGFKTALAYSVRCDAQIHGSWAIVRDITVAKYGTVAEIGETAWITSYVRVRRNWLATHAIKVLHGTVYRMDEYLKIIGANAWDLPLPLIIRGCRIDEQSLAGVTSVVRRVLKLTSPMMQGEDVRELQTKLGVPTDGAFGPGTQAAVQQFQMSKQVVADGVVGPKTWSLL